MFQDWLNIYKAIHDAPTQEQKLACPECGSESIDFQYVGDEKRRIGYLDMWCTTCNKGVHMSRVSIPAEANVISFEAPEEQVIGRIPSFTQVVPLEAE